MSTGDPEAIVLFGLRGDGFKLLAAFLDRTADIQTVALAVSFVSPGTIRSDRRIQRWIETYRGTLDGLQLYATRAIFDSSRGRRARAAADRARQYGRHGEANEIEQALRKAAPPQLIVRCQFCSSTITPGAGTGDRISNHGAVSTSSVKVRTTLLAFELALIKRMHSQRCAPHAVRACQDAPSACRNPPFTLSQLIHVGLNLHEVTMKADDTLRALLQLLCYAGAKPVDTEVRARSALSPVRTLTSVLFRRTYFAHFGMVRA